VKIAIIGGTGKMGLAVANQLKGNHEVIIGSRDPARAREAAKGVSGASGTDYEGAAMAAEVVIVAVPYEAMAPLSGLAAAAKGKLVISMVNPMRMEGGILVFALERGSAAEELAKMLPGSRVATAFNNVPRGFGEIAAPFDILIAADNKQIYEEVAGIVRGIKNLRPLYAGPLSQAGIVERITPLLVNLANLNGTGALATGFVSRKS
jgi:8-hydroxy-5-deazaflavin:NADPH oxidoreductase